MIFRGGTREPDDPYAKYVWEIWPSKGNFILLNGLFITGCQPALLFVALACAFFPFISLVRSRTPDEFTSPSFILLCIWVFITITLILKIALSDPGIIPRRRIAERMYDSTSQDGDPIVDQFKDYPGAVYCRTCEVMRPPSAHHCFDCDNCVLGFDHHCAVLNNCIGQRNYLFFFALMPTLCLLCISFMFQIRVPTSADRAKSERASVFELLSMLFLIFACICLVLVLTLCGYHLWLLVVARTTTKRHIKGLNSQPLSIWERLRDYDGLFHLRARVGPPRDGFNIL